MKYLGITLLLVLVASQAWATQIPEEIHSRISRSLSSKFKNFFEVKLRTFIKQGNATWGVPVLDPLEQSEIILDTDQESVKFVGALTNVHSNGLSAYNVDVAKFALLSGKATVALTFPAIYAKGDYQFEGVAFDDIDIYGKGEFEITAKDFKINTVVALSITGGVKVKSIDLTISLGELDFYATGIFHDENTSVLLSAIISDMAPQIIADYHDKITEAIEKTAKETANAFLEGKSISDIIDMLG